MSAGPTTAASAPKVEVLIEGKLPAAAGIAQLRSLHSRLRLPYHFKVSLGWSKRSQCAFLGLSECQLVPLHRTETLGNLRQPSPFSTP
jgi:hypothetical protein